jgi:hypothetical protein
MLNQTKVPGIGAGGASERDLPSASTGLSDMSQTFLLSVTDPAPAGTSLYGMGYLHHASSPGGHFDGFRPRSAVGSRGEPRGGHPVVSRRESAPFEWNGASSVEARIHLDRAPCGARDHRRVDRALGPRGAGGAADPFHQQPETTGDRAVQFRGIYRGFSPGCISGLHHRALAGRPDSAG